jgi:hypothetical protein
MNPSSQPGRRLSLLFRSLALALLAFVVVGCRSFEKDWAAAATSVSATAHPDLPVTGRWIGTWQNTNNTHAGPLRAVVWQESDRQLKARFHAEWGSRSGSFTSRLIGSWDGHQFTFTGRRRILGVLIRTQGDITPDRFDARYDSRFDRGTFTLHRE